MTRPQPPLSPDLPELLHLAFAGWFPPLGLGLEALFDRLETPSEASE